MAFNPYDSAKQFFSAGNAPPQVVTDKDRDRLQSYELYEKIYWTMPQTFKVKQRGSDASPIYLPSARKIIEACNRFLGVNFSFLVEGEGAAEIDALLSSTFKREKFYTKYATQKRYGLIKGDALWHIVADPDKPETERISIYEVDPAAYFPIMDPNNSEKRIGCHLVDIIVDPQDANGSKRIARRQTYRKTPEGPITSELAHFEVSAWDDRNLPPKDIKRIRTVRPPFQLPTEITALPVYVVPNIRIPGPDPFSYSEIMGIERVFAAVNQAVSDEELSLAMAGLGVYWTTAGPPVGTDGKTIVPWDIGPARMLEVSKDSKVERLQGITSVAPMIEHMEFMLRETQTGVGIPDIAAGKVEVKVAESGISLQLQLSPLLAKNAEKEGAQIEVYDQMFYDLVHGWFPAFEATPSNTTASAVAVTGDPMPKNRKADIDELIALKNAGVISVVEFRTILKQQHGYDISSSADAVIEEAAKRAAAEDPFSARLSNELSDEDQDTGAAGQQNEQTTNGVVIPQ